MEEQREEVGVKEFQEEAGEELVKVGSTSKAMFLNSAASSP